MQQANIPKGRLYLGGAIFIGGFLSPLLIPLVVQSGLSEQAKTIVSGVLMLGVPEVAMLVAVIVLGKPGFEFLKNKLKSSIAEILFPDQVGKWRHHFGLLLLCIPFVLAWMMPYLGERVVDIQSRYTVALTGDLMILAGLLLLGGEFWRKLQELFTYQNNDRLQT